MKKCKTIMLLVTYQCNLKCIYCYEPKTAKKQMTFEQAKSSILHILNSLDESYTEFEIQFMGGEPLMAFPIIKEVSEWLWSQSFKQTLLKIFIVTNGTLINENTRQWFTDNRKKVCLGLSFDGTRLMQNINRSNSAHEIDLDYFINNWPEQTVKVTLSPLTISYLSEGIISLHEVGFSSITADLAMGKDIEWQTSHLEELNNQLHILIDYYLQHPEKHPFSMLDIDICNVSISLDKNCSCGEDLICIDTDGEEYACHLFSPITLTKEKSQSVRETIDFTNHSLFIPEICKNCSLRSVCTICYGMNYLCSDNITQQSPFTCQSFKIIYMANCELQIQLAKLQGDRNRENHIKEIITQIIN